MSATATSSFVSSDRLPAGWHPDAAKHWHSGRRHAAVQSMLTALNRETRPKPPALVLQLAYYLFLAGDYRAAADCIAAGLHDHPEHPELLRNLATCERRAGRPAHAVAAARQYLRLAPDEATAWDTLAAGLYELGEVADAAEAGTRALTLKDLAAGTPPADWTAPREDRRWPAAAEGRANVISLSLWGNDPRYLRGAVDNALAVPHVYPGWQLRVHVDDTVPAALLVVLDGLGADVVRRPSGASLAHKLAWRFMVADDPGVHRFLVRDADAVVNVREASAVREWVASGLPFHVMRDWWTHTDLVLAGLWGGVSGILPALGPMLASYRPPHMETPNIDQWFLRDRVWRFLRGRVLVHDRCFQPPGSHPFPGPWPSGSLHVGQCEFSARPALQAERLAAFIGAFEGAMAR